MKKQQKNTENVPSCEEKCTKDRGNVKVQINKTKIIGMEKNVTPSFLEILKFRSKFEDQIVHPICPKLPLSFLPF
jgi:hypothetical protein